METLALKLILTPVLVGGASLAGRRWGQAIGGWLVGMPFTAGPVAFFIALDNGGAYAAASARGSLAGAVAEAAFTLAYAAAARYGTWPLALFAASLAFAAAVAALGAFAHGLALTLALALAAVVGALLILSSGGREAAAAPLPRWDLPLRMAAATAVVLALTSAVPFLGPALSGILATYPVIAGILTVFAHRRQGAAAAVAVLRGLLYGLFGFMGFFVVLALLVERAGTAAAFAAAMVVSLALQGASLLLVRRERFSPSDRAA